MRAPRSARLGNAGFERDGRPGAQLDQDRCSVYGRRERAWGGDVAAADAALTLRHCARAALFCTNQHENSLVVRNQG